MMLVLRMSDFDSAKLDLARRRQTKVTFPLASELSGSDRRLSDSQKESVMHLV